MNNAQKKIYKDKLLLSAYLQGWNDAEDAHGEKRDEP